MERVIKFLRNPPAGMVNMLLTVHITILVMVLHTSNPRLTRTQRTCPSSNSRFLVLHLPLRFRTRAGVELLQCRPRRTGNPLTCSRLLLLFLRPVNQLEVTHMVTTPLLRALVNKAQVHAILLSRMPSSAFFLFRLSGVLCVTMNEKA